MADDSLFILFPAESIEHVIETYCNPTAIMGSLVLRETRLAKLDAAVQQYFEGGLATSTRKTYRTTVFCAQFGVSNPFPVSQALLCYFVAHLANIGLAYQTIKTYLAAIGHEQIAKGLPEPKQLSSMPKLKVVENGVHKKRPLDKPSHPRLLITPVNLRQIWALWSSMSQLTRLHIYNALGSGLHMLFWIFPAGGTIGAYWTKI